MPPKRGQKRKKTRQSNSTNESDDDGPLLPPDRATWPGWVEMESEPAFFNVMLKEIGVRGVRVQELYSLDEEMLAILPRPVHALIFLFRYKDTDQAHQDKSAECPDHIWFANQIPDFACASVALLNIVNNIKGLSMGKELREFKTFTQDMNPMMRGDAIDGFDFVKRVHNSFARENDLLNADMHLKQKAAKQKKKQAISKARETREAKKSSLTPLKDKSPNIASASTRKSARTSKTSMESNSSVMVFSRQSSPLSDPPDYSDPDFATPSKTDQAATSTPNENRRISARKPQPRKDTFAASAAVEADEAEGFHFIAYMPIEGHVWRLDGLDSFPQDMGAFNESVNGDWMNIAQPALQTRMLMYEGEGIEFNLMAVVHDPVLKDRVELLQNIKELRAIDKKLDKTFEGWRELDGAETKQDVILSTSTELGISQADIDDTDDRPASTIEHAAEEEDLIKLVDMRRATICRQCPLRASVRDGLQSASEDDEKARHRRHGYDSFVRSWLGALAENEVLADLVEEKDVAIA